MNYLFICSRNQWRSRTAETIYKNNSLHQVKSAGTASSARIRVNSEYIQWADIIFVMEQKHKSILVNRFRGPLKHKKIVVLDIEDQYNYMNEFLIEELKSALVNYF